MGLEWEAMVSVGWIARPHGNRGRVIINPDTDFVEERFRKGGEVYVRNGNRIDRLSISDVRFHQDRPIVAFDGIVTMTAAAELASAELRVPMETLGCLPVGLFYYHELLGCQVETVNGMAVGTVSRVDGGGGVYRLVVSKGSTEILVPLVASICVQIEPAAGIIRVEPPEGLLDLNQPQRKKVTLAQFS